MSHLLANPENARKGKNRIPEAAENGRGESRRRRERAEKGRKTEKSGAEKKMSEKFQKPLDKKTIVWYTLWVKQSRALRSHPGTGCDRGLIDVFFPLCAGGIRAETRVFARFIFCMEVLHH